MPLENNTSHHCDEVIITANFFLLRSSVIMLCFMILLSLIVTIFEPHLNHWLSGELTIISLVLAAFIFVLTNMQSIRVAKRRQLLRSAKPNTALISIIDSHLLLDAAIEQQLNGIVSETENAGMSIITAARNISLTNDAIRTMFDHAESQQNLLGTVQEYNIILGDNVTEILGQIQFQDVVRQRVERAVVTVQKRNIILKKLMQVTYLSKCKLPTLAEDMRIVLEQYLQNEKLHAVAFTHSSSQDAALPNIELF